jgi:tRNA pseudouridine38-40 synthase
MDEAARLLEGERDFAPFSGPLPAERGGATCRMYECSVSPRADMIVLDMVASGFLPQQVRRTGGALLDVGLGRTSLQQFSDMAASGIQGAANKVLPPQGLFLVRVSYSDLHFSAEDAGYLWEHMVLAGGVR